LVELEPRAALPVLLVMMAVLAAIMSTADSALLSLSSIATKDFVARLRGLTDQRAERLTRLAPFFSLAILLVIGSLAVVPRFTLWRLLEIKFEILIQLSPAFVFGTLHDRDDPRAFRTGEILIGLFLGLATALGLWALGVRSVYGLHPGVVGVVINYGAVLARHHFTATPQAAPARA
jgi:Na+/proline symporter